MVTFHSLFTSVDGGVEVPGLAAFSPQVYLRGFTGLSLGPSEFRHRR
jgi:hypothetical protein